MEYQIIDSTGINRSFEVRFNKKNKKGENLFLLLNKYENSDTHFLPNLWYKHEYINSVLSNYWIVETFVYNESNVYHNKYNPQQKFDNNISRYVVNFDWLLESTGDNMKKLIDEVYRRFISI